MQARRRLRDAGPDEPRPAATGRTARSARPPARPHPGHPALAGAGRPGAVLLVVGLGMGFPLPYALCFAVIGGRRLAQPADRLASPGQRVFGDWEAAAQLGFDILQIGALLFLTGGAANPFILLLIAPVTLAAATLPLRPVLILGVLAAAVVAALALLSPAAALAPAWTLLIPLQLPARRGAGHHRRHRADRRLRPPGGGGGGAHGAGAGRHPDGAGARTAAFGPGRAWPPPPPTSSARRWPPSPSSPRRWPARRPTRPVREDAELLVVPGRALPRDPAPARPRRPDAAPTRSTSACRLLQLVQEVIEPHAGVKGVRVEAIVTGAAGRADRRTSAACPRCIHALTSFVENAVDFAALRDPGHRPLRRRDRLDRGARRRAGLRARGAGQARRALCDQPPGRRRLAHRPHRHGPGLLHRQDAAGANRGRGGRSRTARRGGAIVVGPLAAREDRGRRRSALDAEFASLP